MKQLSNTQTLPSKQEYVQFIRTLHLPRYHELPDIDLYMDQLLTYIESQLRPLVTAQEKLLTSSMVNNYVKQRIIATPQAKRYTREHLAQLLVICFMKRTFSMSDIATLLTAQEAMYPMNHSYDFFCTAIEESLRSLFCGEVHTETISRWKLQKPEGFAFSLNVTGAASLTPERRIAISAATSAANKIYVEKCFELGILEGLGEKGR